MSIDTVVYFIISAKLFNLWNLGAGKNKAIEKVKTKKNVYPHCFSPDIHPLNRLS